MTRRVVIETEFPVANVNFPGNMDHAWLSVAAGIHRRPFEIAHDDRLVPGLVQSFEMASDDACVLCVDSTASWSDGRSVDACEVAKALARGVSWGAFDDVRVIDDGHLAIAPREGLPVTRLLLASPLFTLTPSCRIPSLRSHPAVCGPYMLSWMSGDFRAATFARRIDDGTDRPDEILLFATADRAQGLRLLTRQMIDLTSTLGADPVDFQKYASANLAHNRLTNLFMVLRPYGMPHHDLLSKMAAQISATLDRPLLARASANTFSPVSFAATDEEVENDISWLPKQLDIRYVDYYPNKEIAGAICEQLAARLGISCVLRDTPYADYVRGRYPDAPGLSLEIIQERVYARADSRVEHPANDAGMPTPGSSSLVFATDTPRVILLQSHTTLMTLSARYANRSLMNIEAHLLWDRL